MFNLFERYAAGLSLLTTVFFEAVAVSWFYGEVVIRAKFVISFELLSWHAGLKQLKSDVYEMLGHTPSLYWRVCWKVVSPAFLFVIMALQMADTAPFAIKLYDNAVYTYPAEARAIGWVLALSSVLMIPIIASKTVLSKKGGVGQASHIEMRIPIFGHYCFTHKDLKNFESILKLIFTTITAPAGQRVPVSRGEGHCGGQGRLQGKHLALDQHLKPSLYI